MSQFAVKWARPFPPGNQMGLPRVVFFADFLVG